MDEGTYPGVFQRWAGGGASSASVSIRAESHRDEQALIGKAPDRIRASDPESSASL